MANSVIKTSYLNYSREFVLRMDACNNRCVFCFVDHLFDKVPNSILRKKVFNEISRARRQGCDIIDFFGGEPTIFPFLYEAMLFAKKNGFRKIRLATNARRFSDEKFAKKISSLGIESVRASLHSHKKNIHEEITRTGGSFDETVAGIKNIVKYKIPVTVNIVITKKNYMDLEKIAGFLKRLGVKNVKFSGLIIEGRAKKRLDLLVDLFKIQPPLKKTINYCLKNKMKFILEKLPICIMPDFPDNFLFEGKKDIYAYFPCCEKCRFRDRCMGMHKDYEKYLPQNLAFIERKGAILKKPELITNNR